jgi:pyrroloquinoline quinone (PQQ) biosynthesis protein C
VPNFVDELQDLRRSPERRAAAHPFIQEMVAGRATDDQVMVQCVQFYFHTRAFVNGLTRLASRCDVPEIQREIAEGVYEEHTGKLSGTAPHLELYLRYASSWGISRKQL